MPAQLPHPLPAAIQPHRQKHAPESRDPDTRSTPLRAPTHGAHPSGLPRGGARGAGRRAVPTSCPARRHVESIPSAPEGRRTPRPPCPPGCHRCTAGYRPHCSYRGRCPTHRCARCPARTLRPSAWLTEGAARASTVLWKRVPMSAPAAPRTGAAATPRPHPRRSTTAGRSACVEALRPGHCACPPPRGPYQKEQRRKGRPAWSVSQVRPRHTTVPSRADRAGSYAGAGLDPGWTREP